MLTENKNFKFSFALDEKLQEYCNKYNQIHNKNSLSPENFLPTKNNVKDIGWEVRCAEPTGVIINPNQYKLINLGFSVFCPEGWFLKLIPNPSLFSKIHCHALHDVIEPSNSDAIKFAIQYIPGSNDLIKNNISISFGDKIAKIIPMKAENIEINQVSKYELNYLHLSRN